MLGLMYEGFDDEVVCQGADAERRNESNPVVKSKDTDEQRHKPEPYDEQVEQMRPNHTRGIAESDAGTEGPQQGQHHVDAQACRVGHRHGNLIRHPLPEKVEEAGIDSRGKDSYHTEANKLLHTTIQPIMAWFTVQR